MIRKVTAWLILSPFIIVLAPVWIPGYGIAWALNELGAFDSNDELQEIANAQYEAAKLQAEVKTEMRAESV